MDFSPNDEEGGESVAWGGEKGGFPGGRVEVEGRGGGEGGGVRGGGPAQALVGGLLVTGHGVHQLQARPLVVGPQQCAAVGVYAAHLGQSLEEFLTYLRCLQAQRRPTFRKR